MNRIDLEILSADSSISLVFYQSSIPSEHRLLADKLEVQCPMTFSVEIQISPSYGSDNDIESLMVSICGWMHYYIYMILTFIYNYFYIQNKIQLIIKYKQHIQMQFLMYFKSLILY